MNGGAFGENFPYSNFHDLNMDWIVKIAKDFLDQYTHIEEVIANGEQSLLNLTADGLQQLQTKADALEALLQQWYDTHSADIANQLAAALADLNSEYADAIEAFNTAAEQKAAQTIETIPADYTTLSNHVLNIQNSLKKVDTLYDEIDEQFYFTYRDKYIDNSGAEQTAAPAGMWAHTGFIHVSLIDKVELTGAPVANGISFYRDTNFDSFISGVAFDSVTYDLAENLAFTVPDGARYAIVCAVRPESTGCVIIPKANLINRKYYSFLTQHMTLDGNAQMINELNIITGKFINGTPDVADDIQSSMLFVPIIPGVKYKITTTNPWQQNLLGGYCFVNQNMLKLSPVYDISFDTYGITFSTDLTTLTDDYEIFFACTYSFRTTGSREGLVMSRDIIRREDALTNKNKILRVLGISTNGLNNRWFNKKGLYHGDSITDGHNYAGYKITYPNIVAEILNMKAPINLATSGWTMIAICANKSAMLNQSVDFIYIAAGTNDFDMSTPMGTIDSTDEQTFYGAMNSICQTLLTNYPSIPIIFATPIRIAKAVNSLGLTMPDYCNAIKAIVNKYGILCNDMYNRFGYDPNNTAVRQAVFYPDVVPNHPYTTVGMNEMANRVASYLTSI